jgi:leucine dehydrogenase
MQITLIDVAGYERVARAEDPESGLLAFIAVHNTTLGPALGGMRLWEYASEEAAQRDVLRLSRGMTFKSSVARTGLGGGKSVILAKATDKSEALFEAMGRFIESFDGLYITAEDVNVGIPDLTAVRSQTSYVTGLPCEQGGSGNPSPYTAYGTYVGVKAALGECFDNDSPEGRSVAVQGLGSVGYALAERLAKAGARLIVCDMNTERVEQAVRELGAEAVSCDDIYSVECDAFSPNALGAILNDQTIPQLRCRIVAGASNNQLDVEEKHAAQLKEGGILYTPDYVINAGGIINVSLELEEGGYNEPAALKKIENIGPALASVFETARNRDITTHAAAQEVAEANLAEARATA